MYMKTTSPKLTHGSPPSHTVHWSGDAIYVQKLLAQTHEQITTLPPTSQTPSHPMPINHILTVITTRHRLDSLFYYIKTIHPPTCIFLSPKYPPAYKPINNTLTLIKTCHPSHPLFIIKASLHAPPCYRSAYTV